jgi:hypothetical protein
VYERPGWLLLVRGATCSRRWYDRPVKPRPAVVRAAKIALVLLAPLVVYLGLRGPREASRAAVWAELAGDDRGPAFRPRTAIFDGARRRVEIAGARGEVVSFALRLSAQRPARAVRTEIGPLRGRAGEIEATVRVLREEGGALVPARPLDVAAGTAAAWHVEVEIPAGARPGRYGARLEVLDAEGPIERLALLVEVRSIALGAPSVWVIVRGDARARSLLETAGLATGRPAGRGVPLGKDPRLSAWQAFAAGAAWIEGTGAPPPVSVREGTPYATPSLVRLRESVTDLKYLGLLRARGEPMLDRIVRRVLGAPPRDAEAWEQVRRELAGLLLAGS